MITKTDGLVAKEREVTAELLRHLREIERRHLHLEMGFASMFELLVKHFKYSEGAAARRLGAMRLSRDVPEVSEAIQSGKLSLSAASQAHQFLVNEKKRGKTYTQAEKSSIAQKLYGKSRRECQLMAKLEKLRGLLAHHGSLSYAELIERLADQTLKKLDPEQKQSKKTSVQKTGEHVDASFHSPAESATVVAIAAAVTEPASTKPSAPTSQEIKPGTSLRKPISAADKRAIWQRAGGSCEYVDPVSGRRCGSRWALEIDHIRPLAMGGAHDRSNFRLCCKKHNLFLAVQTLGAPVMARYLRK